jgi:hypothetical protein
MPSQTYHNIEHQDIHAKLFKESITAPLEAVRPPGLTQYAFNAAVMQYMAIVGHDQVLQGNALAEYIDPYELHEAEGKRKMPSAAVRPKNVEELRRVLKISNEYNIPVWTFSRGKNLGYIATFIPFIIRPNIYASRTDVSECANTVGDTDTVALPHASTALSLSIFTE